MESKGFDVVHFPTQLAYLTEVPSIYQPWDLQHLHYPEFFSKAEFRNRAKLYPLFCNQAKYVCVQTNWGKQDLVEKFQLPPEKVEVIRWGSALDAYGAPSTATITATIQKFGLPRQFFFYPAATWVHKNHEVIIRALDVLKRDHGRKIEIYFSGACLEFRAQLDVIARDLEVSEQVHFLGFLPPEELQAFFATATAMVFASRFEGFGLPLLESFQSRLPVLSSRSTVLPEVAEDGALYFDANSPIELANRMRELLDDESLRRTLIERGLRVLSKYSIKETAAKFQALYEKTAKETERPRPLIGSRGD